MMKLAFTTVAVAVFFLATVSAFAKCDGGEVVIKFSHVVAAKDHPKGEAAERLAERVNREMDGKACMQVYPNSQLYDDDKVLEAMLRGDVQLAAPSLSKFEKYTKKYRIFDLPFLFESNAAIDRFIHSKTGEELLHAMDNVGFAGLGYWLNGLKQFSARKPLLKPSDASGLRFRVQTSDVAVAMIRAMGAVPHKMAFKEVYHALEAGIVDGEENTYSNIYTQKFFKVQDGVTETNYQALAYLLVTSRVWLDGLPKNTRPQFLEILDEVTKEANDKANSVNEAAKQKIIEAGGEVHTLTKAQRAEWVKVMKPVWTEFEKDIGKDVIDAALSSGK